MVDNLTIGTLWQDKRTQKLFELVAMQGAKVQIATTLGKPGDYKTMTQKSLRTHYSLKAIKASPEIVKQINTTAEIPDNKNITTTTATKKYNAPGRIEMPDGRVILGLHFLRDIVCDLEAVKAGQRSQSIIYWLSNIAAGKEILAKFDAQIVYGKELTK